jgi:hypothetical protein
MLLRIRVSGQRYHSLIHINFDSMSFVPWLLGNYVLQVAFDGGIQIDAGWRFRPSCRS